MSPRGAHSPDSPFLTRITLYQGDVLSCLGPRPDNSVHCVVTSPPYWILRNYDIPETFWPAMEFIPVVGLPPVQVPAWYGCFGMEPDPWAFVGHMVLIFRELRRVLRDDGTLWLNLADCYSGAGGSGGDYNRRGCRAGQKKYPGRRVQGLPAKNLVGIPARVILALQADGWIWRSDIIWNKLNVRPAPFKDRPTVCHENIFLLSKKPSYFYDDEAIKEEVTGNAHHGDFHAAGRQKGAVNKPVLETRTIGWQPGCKCDAGDPIPCTVLDPFSGSGTTAMVAAKLGRDAIGIELNPDYVEMSSRRLSRELGMWTEIQVRHLQKASDGLMNTLDKKINYLG